MGTTWLIWIAGLVVAVHGGLALLSQRLDRAAERAHPPTGTLLVDGGLQRATEELARRPDTVHFRDGGPRDAPVIVLVHGASTSLLDFEPSLRRPLEHRFRVVSVDRPGSGWSVARDEATGDPGQQAAAVVEVLDALGIERASWVGHSWGGAVVLAAMLDHPERIERGVALAAATHPWEEALPRTIRFAATPGIGHLLAACWVSPLGRRVLDDAVADSFRPESPPADLAGYLDVTGAALTVRGKSFRATALDLVGLQEALADMVPRYATIEHPLLLVNGDADPLVPAERHADRLASALPAARTVRIEGAGHILHHTRTERVVALIEAFAAQAPSEPDATGNPTWADSPKDHREGRG